MSTVQHKAHIGNEDIQWYDGEDTFERITSTGEKITMSKVGGIINVKNAPFSAVGDGSADDTDALQAAIKAIETVSGGILFFPNGIYKIISALVFTGHSSGRIIIGGDWAARIYNANTSSENAITVGSTGYNDSQGYAYLTIRDLYIDGNSSSGHGISLLHARKVKIIDCYILNHGGDGIYTDDSWANHYIGCRIHNNGGHGISLNSDGNSVVIDRCDLLDHDTANKAGIYIVGCDSPTITKCDFEGNTYGVLVANSEGSNVVKITKNHFETNTTAIEVQNTSGGSNILGVEIDKNLFYEDPVNIGTDASGTAIDGGLFKGNYLNNVAATTIGGSKVTNFEIGGNILAGTASISIGDHHLSTADKLPAHEVMPLYGSTPTEPWGTGDTKGHIGDFRWSAKYGWLNTSNGEWRIFQLGKISAIADTLQGLPTGATPNVSGLEVCQTANTGATSVTSLSGGYPSQKLYIVGLDGGNTTFVNDNDKLNLAGGANFAIGDYDVLTLVCINGTKWTEVSRSDN